MPTDKKPVTSYLSDDLEKQLTNYCNSKGLVRDYKDGQTKPQLGTAIVEILESFFCVDDEVSSPPPDQVSELKELIHQLATRVERLESSVGNVPDTIPSDGLSKVNDSGKSSQSTTTTVPESTTHNVVGKVPDTLPSDGLSKVESNGKSGQSTTTTVPESTTHNVVGNVPDTVPSDGLSKDENLETSTEETPSESTLETAKDTAQDENPLMPPETLDEAKSEESLIVTAVESQVYLISLKNDDKEPTELVRGFDFSCKTDDSSDLMKAIKGCLYENDLIDPDDKDLNIKFWDNREDWKKANKGRGLTKPKMAKKIGVAPNTVKACINGTAGKENQKLYEDQVMSDYFWCHLTQQFYRR